jgi:preprotein translocase subunit SecD
LAVVVFMMLYYRFCGFLADAALVLYCLLVLAVMVQVPVVLTLPGIAGLLLSVGMAVDANVIIFERLKEELRAGRTPDAAIEAGFKRAWTAILDCNITTLLACVALYAFGTGPVKGFALTLAIGVFCSFFTAVTVTRAFVLTAVRTSRLAESPLFTRR